MYLQSSQMEPLYPARTGELEDLARELVAVSAQLKGRLAPVVRAEIEVLLRQYLVARSGFRAIAATARNSRGVLSIANVAYGRRQQ